MQDTAPQTPPPARPPMRPWQRVLLVASLALNLAILGAAIGFFAMNRGPDGRHGPPRVDRMGGPLTHALSHEDRRAIGRAIWKEYREGRPSRADQRAQYDAVIAALRAEPYAADVVERNLEDQLSLATERQRVGQRILLERLAAMSAEERTAFADRLQEGLDRRDHEREEHREGREGRDRD